MFVTNISINLIDFLIYLAFNFILLLCFLFIIFLSNYFFDQKSNFTLTIFIVILSYYMFLFKILLLITCHSFQQMLSFLHLNQSFPYLPFLQNFFTASTLGATSGFSDRSPLSILEYYHFII